MGHVVAMLSRPPGPLRFMAAPAEGPEVDCAGRNACRIAVIGGGFSGVLVTLHLLWRCGRDDRIYLIERASRFGQGLAYASGNPQHLLNVPIEDMSALADEPDHFAGWLAGQPETERAAGDDPGFAGGFVRRQMYGAYITHLLTDSITRMGCGRNLYLINDEATALRPADGGFLLETGVAGPTASMRRCWRSATSRPTRGRRRATMAIPGTRKRCVI